MKVDFEIVVPQIKAGNKQARDLLWQEFMGWSVRRAMDFLPDKDLASDVAVDFWNWLFERGGIQTFDPDRGRFFPWMNDRLTQMARNKLRDTIEFRPRITHTSASLDDEIVDFADPLELAVADDLKESMRRRVVACIGRQYAGEVFDLLVEEYTAMEIADHLGIEPKTTANIVTEIRQLLGGTDDADV